MSKQDDFNNFRFAGLNYRKMSNKYLTMNRVSADESKIVVRIGSDHILPTEYGYALILNSENVCFLKHWQVSDGPTNTEVLLQKEYFKVKQWGNFPNFPTDDKNLAFESWLEAAKAQDGWVNQEGHKMNPVKWLSNKYNPFRKILVL